MRMVQITQENGIRTSAQAGADTPSATRTGTKASGQLTPWKGRAGSHSQTSHTMNAAGI